MLEISRKTYRFCVLYIKTFVGVNMHSLHIYSITKNIYTIAFRQTRLYLNKLFAPFARLFDCPKNNFDV
jgi:hypothetical protein